MKAALFDAPRERVRLSRCRDLVPIERKSCLRCGGPTRPLTIAEPALLRHGGYGATRQTTFEACDDSRCGGVRLAQIDEVSPR